MKINRCNIQVYLHFNSSIDKTEGFNNNYSKYNATNIFKRYPRNLLKTPPPLVASISGAYVKY